MIEKVNPSHPDKVADRIAGAIVDLAYKKQDNPKIAVEVLFGHSDCHIIAETSVHFEEDEILKIVDRISPTPYVLDYKEVPQDVHLAENQSEGIRCGDNGIFKGVPTNKEEEALSKAIRRLYKQWESDGKFIYSEKDSTFIACQSNLEDEGEFKCVAENYLEAKNIIINPLGFWTGGTDVDTGATNRKLGSDMGRAVTGGGLHGKDLSKADVSVNIACAINAEMSGQEVEALCAIGDKEIVFRYADGAEKWMPYANVIELARDYINDLGGFEKLAEWGLF